MIWGLLFALQAATVARQQPASNTTSLYPAVNATGAAPIGSTTVAPASKAAASPAPSARAPRTIIVDAGHGGPDNGMTGPIGKGPKVIEKNVTLTVAKLVGRALEQRGVHVVYTRTTDTLIALSDRGRIANAAHGNLFISIHVNAANPGWDDPGAARGYETYFLSDAKTDDAKRVEQMENQSTRFETAGVAGKDDPLNFILNDMAQNEYLRESSELADIVQRSLGHISPGPSRGVKQAGFQVLVTAFMPSVLVEIGFGTNPAEAAWLTNPDKQAIIAGAIADAAMEYLDRYDRRTAGSPGAPR